MACCVLAALIVGNIVALWHARRRVALYAGVSMLAVLIALFGAQWIAHRHAGSLADSTQVHGLIHR